MTNIDVWQLGQDIKANEFYKSALSTFLGDGCVLNGREIDKANGLTKVCNEMSRTYDQIIDDQNDYIVDIDTSLNEISDLENDLEAKIKQLEEEILQLTQKQEDGTITPDEEAELASKTQELTNLKSKSSAQIDAKNNELNKSVEKANAADKKSKSEIATDYGETALEKGKPLSETKDKKKSFWRKTFGGWNKQAERDAGKKLLEAGNNLLSQVSISADLDKEIVNKTKKSV